MSTKLYLSGIVCLFVLIPTVQTKCQTTAVGARSASLAGISSVEQDVWAAANNPAGLGGQSHLSLATSAEQRFLMKELGYYAFAAAVPSGKGCLGVFAMFSGYKAYIDQKLSFSYGRRFGEYVFCGTSMVYIFQKAGSENRPIHQVSYELGTIINLSKKVKLAFAAFNPFQLYYKSETYATLPSIFKIGISAEYSPSLFLFTECEKDMEFPPIVKVGSEYIFRDIFFIRGGIRIFPVSYSFGAGMRHNGFLFEFSSSFHQYLGFTPLISLQYDLK